MMGEKKEEKMKEEKYEEDREEKQVGHVRICHNMREKTIKEQ